MAFNNLQKLKIGRSHLSPPGLNDLLLCCPRLQHLALTQISMKEYVEGDVYSFALHSVTLKHLVFSVAGLGSIQVNISAPNLIFARLHLDSDGLANFVSHQLNSLNLHACHRAHTMDTFSGVRELTWHPAWCFQLNSIAGIPWSALIGLLDQMTGLEVLNLSCHEVFMDGPSSQGVWISRFFKGLGSLLHLSMEGDWFFRSLAVRAQRAADLAKGQRLSLQSLKVDMPDPLLPICQEHLLWLLKNNPYLKRVEIEMASTEKALAQRLDDHRRNNPEVRINVCAW
jgi:hypothetical protein